MSFNEYQTLVSGNESDSFIAFHKLPVCCCSMNSESFRGQPLLFHAPPPAPAFTFIYCAVNVNAPADFMKMVPTSPMFYIPSSSSSCALAFVCRLPMGGRQAAGGCACVSWSSLIFFFFAPRLAPCYRYVATIQFSKKRSKVDYGTIARFSTVVPQDSVLRSMRGAVRVRTDKHCSNSKCDVLYKRERE